MEEANNNITMKALSEAIHKEARERFMTGDYNGKKEYQIVAEETIAEFSDYLDKIRYIRDFHLLAGAVCFYMVNSPDHIETKKRVQGVFEYVIENEEALKESYERLFMLKNALEDVFNVECK